MTPNLESAFLVNMASAMRRSSDAAALERLWASYEEDIAQCSPQVQTELQRLRAQRSRQLAP